MASVEYTRASASVNEVFRRVPGYPGYQVSDLGRVQSLRHANGLPSKEWRTLSPGLDCRGYPQVRLYAVGRRPRWFHVHILVLTAFRGPAPRGMVARHVLTNDPADCRLVNLAWGTQVENMADKWRHGTAQTKENMGPRFTRAESAELARRRLCGATYRALSTECGRSYTAVQQAVRREFARRARSRARIELPMLT